MLWNAGARIHHDEERVLHDADGAVDETRGTPVVERPTGRKRRSRVVQIWRPEAGQESTSAGVVREQQQGQQEPGIFTAAAYYWMFYELAPRRDLVDVAPGEVAGPGQCHAVLDPAANLDADSVAGSNSTYEYAGVGMPKAAPLLRH